MNWYNRFLLKVLIVAIIANGCMAMALVDEEHQIRSGQQKVMGALPPVALQEMPVPGMHKATIKTPRPTPKPRKV